MTRISANAESSPVELPTRRTSPFQPPAELTALREEQPLCPLRFPDGHVGWIASSHGLARELLGDPRFSLRPLRLPIGNGEDMLFQEALEREIPEVAKGSLLSLDPPEHARLRRAQAGYFTVRRIGEHRAKIERIVSRQLDLMEAQGPPVDLVEAFALPIPSRAICELLGAPEENRDKFERPTRIGEDPAVPAEERIEAMRDAVDFVNTLIAEKRARPADDLLSALIADGELTDEELAGAATLLFGAGHSTTATMLSLGTFTLLSDRARWEHLRAHPEAIGNAVEELLRYLTIFHLGAFSRTATEDVEVEGVVIREGESLIVSLTAANRDPQRFPDPDAFDVSRDASQHLAFGHGRHICLGQHLARLELQIGLAALIERFPGLRLAIPPEEVPMSHERLLHGVERLPVTWSQS